ncbi:NAD(P)/FAD-dependent oxidoreductase [Evansella cellulosilytica]|uniref:FAD dependent oxidoreductase n=1 Tax=Evansella cellulosilytica (strain ATCC 21833 / DSM 2522 / FERM P-1141 / JCM 9156 / N-4) TaxID=649639 RepID=E6U0W1_EVAC2|nr:FAD-binding oxidoreductase [Evansella cellulosilytica]ADU30273.1 FAD dependent oxidoreductase [Evansella cellulosilytica DSM 2522]
MDKIIIIGAGILGASAAYELSKIGFDVTIIDRHEKGQATRAAAGIIAPWLSQRRNMAWYDLARRGAKHYPQLIKELESDGEWNSSYKKVGVLKLHDDLNKLEKLKLKVEGKLKQAPEIGDITILSSDELEEKFPIVSKEHYALYVTGAARINGNDFCQSLIRAAQKRGVKVIKGNAEIITNEESKVFVKVNGQQLNSSIVVCTVGAWESDLLKPLQIERNIKPQKAQILHLEIDGVESGEWPVVMPPNNQYFVPFDNGQIVVGTTHEDNVGFDMRTTAGAINEILSKALQFAPGLKDSAFKEARVGFRPVAPQFLPTLGQIPHYNRLYVANGLGSSGLTVGPYLGRQLALLVSGRKPDIDLSPYSLLSNEKLCK